MSQVIRKYNSGGKSPEEPELFEWKDVGKYNKSDLISGLYRNVDTYITNNNLSGKKADAFRTATSRLIDGIKNGTVTLNGDGTFNVSDKSLSSTGQFDKNFLGGEKNTDNNANNRAGDYVLDYIKSMNTYKKPTVAAPKKEKFDFNKYFTGEVSRRWYGGNDIDNDNFFNRRSEEDRLKLMADIAGGITPEMLSSYDLEGTIGADEILNRSKRFVEAINNGTLDNNDYNAFAELGGGGLDRWLKPQEEQTAAVDVRGDLRRQWEAEARQKGYTDEAIQAYIDNKQRALDEASQKEVDARNTAQEEKLHADAKAIEEERIRQLGASNIRNYNTISTLPEVTPYNFEGVYKSRYENPWSLSFSAYDLNPDKSTQTVPLHREDGSGYYDSVNIGKTVPGTTAAQRLANDLDYYIRAAERNANDPDIKSQALEQLGSGEYVIPDSYNPNTGLIRVYNPKTRQLRWVEALTTQTGKDLFEEGYRLETAPKYKADGGILKAQQGETIDWNTRIKSINESKNNRTREAVLAKFKRIEEEEAAKKAAETKPSAANLTPEQRAARERKPAETGFTGVDIARLGAIGADIASMIPGLGGVGIAGTLANFGADIADDGMDLGDWGRLAGNIGLDVVGFIPGLGAAAKGSRVLKNVVKWAPRLLSIATAGNYGPAGIQSLQKAISTPKDLTVDDYRNIAEVIKVAIGGGRGIKRGIQSHNLKNAAKTGDYQITTNKGEKKLTANQYNEIISHKKLADQNAALQLLLKDDDLNIPKKANWRMGTNSIIRHDYDFNKTKKVMTSKGEIEVPLVYSRSEKQIAGNMQRSFPSIPGFEKAPQWYNAYKYRKLNADNPAEVKPSSSKPSSSKSTALVPTGKRNEYTKENAELQGYIRHTKEKAAADANKRADVDDSKFRPSRAVANVARTREVAKNDRLSRQAASKETQRTKNEALAAWAVNQPFPKQPLAGAARTNKQRSYEQVFGTVPNYQRVEGSSVQTPARPTLSAPAEGRTYTGFIGIRRPVSNPPALIPKAKINPLDKFLQQSTHSNVVASVNKQLEDMSKRVAENIVRSNTRPGRPIQSVVNDLVPGKVRGHDKRARELQSTFDTPVVMEPVMPAAKPIVIEPYVSKSKSKPKKSKARKKVSKDDRVTKKADGGLLIPKFQYPAAPIQRRNVRSADDLSWNNDILNSLGLKNTLGNITPANASKYNNMQGDYAKLGFGTSKPGDTSLTYDPNAVAYQTTFNNLTSVNQDTMSDLVRRGRITGRGGSSDKGTQWTADGLKGDQTFLRHLGTAATTKEGMDVLKSLVPDDIDVIKNLNQGMVNFMPKLKMAGITDGKGFNIPNTPIATTGLLDETVPDVEATPQDIKTTNNSGSYKLNTKGKAATNVLSGLRTLPEDIIALGRMVGGLRANRRAADKYKEGLKPLLVDTYENVVPITGNYLAKVSADKQASNLTSLAARPRTSDGSLQLAGELEAGNRAAQMRFQGDMADADMFNRTRTLAQQESDAAKARRTDVANRNRASMLQINAAKKQIDSAEITNNYERVISPYLAGIEGRFRQNRAAGKQFDLEQARLASATKYRPQLQALQDRYLEAQKNNDQEGMKAAMNDYYQLVDAQNQEMLAQRKKLTQMPWLFEKVNPVQAKIPLNKSGAKMNSADRIIMQRARDFNKRMLEDNKQLHKNINESKKQQADLIKHMSSLTAELIKKGMSWK